MSSELRIIVFVNMAAFLNDTVFDKACHLSGPSRTMVHRDVQQAIVEDRGWGRRDASTAILAVHDHEKHSFLMSKKNIGPIVLF